MLVDGYNAMHEPDLSSVTEAGLCRLLAKADQIAHWGVPLRVVCDGRPKPGRPSFSPVPKVELVFSGKDQSADDVIIHQIQASSSPRQLIVVSSDHEIQKAAKRRKAIVWASSRFTKELWKALAIGKGQGQAIGHSVSTSVQMGPQQVVGWLRYFGFDAEGQEIRIADDNEKPRRSKL